MLFRSDSFSASPLTTTPSSILPSPPNQSPESEISTRYCDPIGPPKRLRPISTNNLLSDKLSTKPRSASASSMWTPFSDQLLSPFVHLDPNPVFDDESEEDDLQEGIRDEQTLARSLRKIARSFQRDRSWTWQTETSPF